MVPQVYGKYYISLIVTSAPLTLTGKCLKGAMRSEPRAGEGRGRPQGLGRSAGWPSLPARAQAGEGATIANYLCRYVHTQLPIIYVGLDVHTFTHITNRLCRWEPPRPDLAGMIIRTPSPAPPPPPRPCCYLCVMEIFGNFS